MDGNPSKVIHQFMNSSYTEYWSYLLSKTEEKRNESGSATSLL
jgi:hypothetical protein